MKKIAIFKILTICFLLAASEFLLKGVQTKPDDQFSRKELQTKSDDQSSRKELQTDFLQFRQLLEENHCCLYEYSSREQMDSLFGLSYNRINDSMKLEEFFRLLAPNR